MSESSFDLAPLEEILAEFKGQKGMVIPILQRTQEAYGFLPKELLQIISKKTHIPLTRLYGVATFYAQFHLKRRGRHIVRICDGTACHVRGAPKSIEALGESLQVQPGGTSPDYKYTLEIVYCLGSCGLAPVALIDDKVYGQTKPEILVEQLENIE
jgi:NADH-quinone oxidoreductase subunit E